MPRSTRSEADAVGCEIDQIAKSILFAAGDGRAPSPTAGGNRADAARARALAGTPPDRAGAVDVCRTTGSAIGRVAPVEHLAP